MPQTSVIIPTYNYGRFLREAVESVRAQTVEDLEILVIDNGSTDNTREVIASIEDPRLRVISFTSNRGISAALNEGLEQASGEFIAFLDADDRWRASKLATQLEFMRAEPEVGVIFTDFVRFNEHGFFPLTQFTFFPELRHVPSVPVGDEEKRRITADPFCSIIRFSDFPVWLGTMLFRREGIGETRFRLDLRICMDLHFCFQIFRRTGVGYITEPLIEVRRHGENNTENIPKVKQDILAALRRLAAEPLRADEQAALRRRIGRAWVDSGYALLELRHPLEAARAFCCGLGFSGARVGALKGLVRVPPLVLFLIPSVVLVTRRTGSRRVPLAPGAGGG